MRPLDPFAGYKLVSQAFYLDISLFIASWLVKTTIEGPDSYVEQTELFIAMEKAFNF